MDTDLKQFIGGQLRALRRNAKLNQAELAERIERTSEAISNIERGKSLPALDTLIAIAQVLNVPVQDFFPEPGLKDRKSSNRVRLEAEAQAILRSLSDDRAKIALAQLKALAGA